MKTPARTLPVLLTCAFCSIPLRLSAQSAPPQKPTKESVKQLLAKTRKKQDLPAMGVCILTSKGVQIVAVKGVRKRGDDTPVTTEDQFHLGSDSKAFTATLIGLLVEDGKLRWDLTMAEAFPDLKEKMVEDVRTITLKHLLTQVSGFPSAPKSGWWAQYGKGTVPERRLKFVEEMITHKPVTKPGTKFSYGNLNYVIAAAMVEQVMKETWENLVRKRIFKPLGMTTAGFGPMGEPGSVSQPWAHDSEGKPIKPDFRSDNPPVLWPAGGIHCSLPDWSRFVLDVLRGGNGKDGLLKAQICQQMQSTTGKDGEYTLAGWGRRKSPIGVVLAHDGSNTRNFATAWVALDQDVAVLVTCNQGGKKAEKGSRDLALSLFRTWILSHRKQ